MTRLSQMFSSLISFLRERSGVAAIEFALFVPLFLLVLIGVIEYGRVLAQANAVEKGLRAGAMLAARSDFPLSGAQEQRIKNMVMTGNVAGTPPYLVAGWGEVGASLVVDSDTFNSAGVVNLPVFRLAATVPYQPLLPGLMSMFGLDDLVITTAHEQARIGN